MVLLDVDIQGGPKLSVLRETTWSDFSLDGVIVFAMFGKSVLSKGGRISCRPIAYSPF